MAKKKRRKLKWSTRVNPLLAIPPKGVHGLDVAGGQWFAKVMGRPVTKEDYHGVHTTGSKTIAQGYAQGAVKEAGGFPVILSLNVNGLEALPDVDAMAQAKDLLEDRSLRNQYEGMGHDEACDAGYDDGPNIRVGQEVVYAFMEYFQQNQLCSAFTDEEEWERWLETGEYSAETATNVVDQRRYMADFGIDRLIAVNAAKPWWPYLVDEPYDDESTRRLEVIEDAGYKTIGYDDLFNDTMVESKVISKGKGSKVGYPQYHGTSSLLVAKAFPSLGHLNNPFHTDYSAEEVEEMLDAEGLSGNPRRARKKTKRKKKAKDKRVTGVRGLVAKALK